MSRVRIMLLIASLLWLGGCADPDPDQTPPPSPVANNFFMLPPLDEYEATHPDGPYRPVDAFIAVPPAPYNDNVPVPNLSPR